METTFSFFPGLFETHALAKYYFKKKTKSKLLLILTSYECVKNNQ